MSKSTLPCIDCICLAMCKSRISNNVSVGIFLTGLTSRCSTLFKYLDLYDLGLSAINTDVITSTYVVSRRHVIVAVSKRILKICEYMEWEPLELEKFKLLAQGIFPKDQDEKAELLIKLSLCI